MSAQRGIALITAIILVALAAVLATAIGFSSAMAARRATTMFGADQSFLAAQGVEAMAAAVLKLTSTNNATASINLSGNSHWADPYGPYELGDGISLDLAQIEDEQGKFNINNLAPNGTTIDDNVTLFQHLTQKVTALTGVTIEDKWAWLIADWIDVGNEPNPDGAEDSVYLSQTPPYRPPNIPITSISELMALPGFGRARYDALAPYITALPPGSSINICTASGVLLDALANQSEFSTDPASLANERKEAKDCFPQQNVFTTLSKDAAQVSSQGLIGTTSSYFRLRSFITIGTAHFTLYSLLYRDQQNGPFRPILRTFGTE